MLAVIAQNGSYFETQVNRRKKRSAIFRPDRNVYRVKVVHGGIQGMAMRALQRYVANNEAQKLCPDPCVVSFYSRQRTLLGGSEYVCVGVYTLPEGWREMVRAGMASAVLELARALRIDSKSDGMPGVKPLSMRPRSPHPYTISNPDTRCIHIVRTRGSDGMLTSAHAEVRVKRGEVRVNPPRAPYEAQRRLVQAWRRYLMERSAYASAYLPITGRGYPEVGVTLALASGELRVRNLSAPVVSEAMRQAIRIVGMYRAAGRDPAEYLAE